MGSRPRSGTPSARVRSRSSCAGAGDFAALRLTGGSCIAHPPAVRARRDAMVLCLPKGQDVENPIPCTLTPGVGLAVPSGASTSLLRSRTRICAIPFAPIRVNGSGGACS